MKPISRPEPGEYAPYYGRYLELVPDGDVMALLAEQQGQLTALLEHLSDGEARRRYAPGKWSIKEVLGHVIDVERLFSLRGLWFARQDPSALPGMEQDDWARHGHFDSRQLLELIEDYKAARSSSLALLHSFDESMWLLRGTASGCEFTVRCIPYIMAGHQEHHQRMLRERYL